MKRKMGEALGASEGPRPRQRKRAKTYQTVMHVNNMLLGAADVRLAHFKPRVNDEGEFMDCPFTLPSLSISPDAGPDNMCMMHFLGYKAGLNVTFDFDLSHSLQNASKQAPRSSFFLRLALELQGPQSLHWLRVVSGVRSPCAAPLIYKLSCGRS